MIFFSFIAFAQKTISGKVTDEDGVAIPSASVTIEEPGKDAILAYGITNSKGEYKVTFTTSQSNVDIKVKAFNQKTAVKQVSNADQTLSFKLQSEATEIKEVQIKTKMITSRGDTIAYDLKAFDSKSDRSLADVMKKIPGIEVNDNGTILYQGNAINKFYVNGKDIMEGGYGTISNSLPKDAVQKVEVLENHQPVKMLQGKIASESAAINVQLKKSITMTGRGEVGSGFADPWLWNVKLTPMFFGQKTQWVMNYKTNNMGEQVENEGNILSFGGGWEGRRSNVGQTNWLKVETASTPNVPVKRYLMNNVHYLSANLLTNIDDKKEWELKVNANYTNNAVERESATDVVDVQQNTNYGYKFFNNFYTDKFKGEVIFTKNAKKGFFKNTTTFSQFWNANRALADRYNNSINRSGSQGIESPTSSFQNSLSTIIPWKEKMVNLKSYISYQDDRQTLQISPASYLELPYRDPATGNLTTITFAPGSSAYQSFRIKNLDTSHSANVSFTSNGWTFTPQVGIDFSTDDLTTNFDGVTANNSIDFSSYAYENTLKFTRFTPQASLGINYKSDNWTVYANMPFNFNNIKAEDPLRLVNKSLNKVTFNPNVFAQYAFASFFKASVNASLNNTFGDIQTSYAGYILTSPTGFNVMNKNNPIPETESLSGGARLEYRNPLNNLFFNVGYRISNTTNNLLASNSVNESGFSVIEYIESENKRKSNSYYAEIGKYFPKFKTNASVTYSLSDSKNISLRNGNLFENQNQGNSLGFKFNNTYFSWMSVDFNATKTWNKQINGIQDSKTEGYTHNLSTFFYPIENHTIGFYWDQMNSNLGMAKYKNAFFDLSYQYTWAAKKIDFELKWMNIANKKTFERVDLREATIETTRMILRPSQVMLSVKFNFK